MVGGGFLKLYMKQIFLILDKCGITYPFTPKTGHLEREDF